MNTLEEVSDCTIDGETERVCTIDERGWASHASAKSVPFLLLRAPEVIFWRHNWWLDWGRRASASQWPFISFTGRNWEQRRKNGSPWVIKEVTKFIRGGGKIGVPSMASICWDSKHFPLYWGGTANSVGEALCVKVGKRIPAFFSHGFCKNKLSRRSRRLDRKGYLYSLPRAWTVCAFSIFANSSRFMSMCEW